MKLDLGVQTAIATALESAIRVALQYDPATALALGRLEGQVLAVEVSQPEATFYLLPNADGLAVQSFYDGEVNTRLRGSPLALLNLVRSKEARLSESGVEVIGSTHLLMELQKILHNLDLDWEAALSDVVGDLVGHQAAQWLKRGFGWAKDRQASFERLLGEFLTEEFRATPSKSEMRNFHEDVDQARFQADRIAAKVAEAKRRREAANSPPIKSAADNSASKARDENADPTGTADNSDKPTDPSSSIH